MRLHPVVSFTFLMMALAWGMVLTHPIYLAVSAVCSFVTMLLLGQGSKQRQSSLLLALLLLCLVNPLFNTRGDTVLFYYFGTRAYTLEALLYGGVLALLFFTVANWFACYHVLISSDRLVFLLGRHFPAASLLVSMILKFIPNYERKLREISAARSAIGKGLDTDTRSKQLEHAARMLSALTSVALEGSLMTADSMKSRGYGLPGRSRYASYRFTWRDAWCEGLLIGLCCAVLVSWLAGGGQAQFLPGITLTARGWAFYLGILSYAMLLSLPIVYMIFEEIKWNYLRSKI